MVAPAILGQYDAPLENVYGAIKAIGFTDVIEVAEGAMETIRIEGAEFLHKMHEGQPFMTTSCCPSYIEMARKHAPELQKYISDTGSPMYYTARIARKQYPDGRMVFIGPCVAKRKEAQRDEEVDYVMTFDEIGALMEAYDINTEFVQPHVMEVSTVREAQGFAQAGGVMGAVKAFLKMEVNGIQMADLNKKNIAALRAYAKTGKVPAKFIEVMACEGGCITGPATYSGDKGKRMMVQNLAKWKNTY
jgi:iron only hydrogenase large subunit-like protein